MEFKGFNKTWAATSFAFKISAFTNAALAIALLLAVSALSQNKERIVLVPPHIPKGMELSWTAASPEYFKSIGLWLSGVIGGTNVDNLDFTNKTLERFFAPPLREELRIRLARIAKDPMRAMMGTQVWFEPGSVIWEQQSEKVFVPGTIITVQPGMSSPGRMDATYEFSMRVADGIPQVIGFNSYQGEPRTLEWLQRPDHLGLAEERRKAEQESELARAAAQSEDARRAEQGH